MTDNKNDTISKVYFDPAGYGSINTTLKDAKQIDKTITLQDVKNFFDSRVNKKTNLKGSNSFVAPYAYYEYQIDLMFIKYLEKQEHTIAMICIDIFSKYCVIVPIKSKKVEDLSYGFLTCMNEMKRKPEVVYSDGETGLQDPLFTKYFEENKISFIPTRTHPHFVERMIRTFREMLDKRMENDKDGKKQWTDYIFPILLTYNNKLVHSATGFTPNDARKPENGLQVFLNIKMKAKKNRVYPDVEKGDKVKIYQKRKPGEKVNVSVWSNEIYTVEDVSEIHGINFYKTSQRDRPYLRHEILLVKH